MAYTAVKLADVNKAINAVKAAQIKYNDAVKNSGEKSTFGTAAKNALTKLEKAQKDFEKETFVTQAIKNQKSARDKAYDFMMSEGWRNTGEVKRLYDLMMNPKTSPAAAKAAEINYGKAVEKASKDAETTFNNLDKAYNTSYEKAKNDAWYKIDGVDAKGNPNKQSLQYIYNTTQEKWQQQIDSVQPLLEARDNALSGVTGYIDTIRDSLGDVTKFADAKAVQTLLNQIQTSVKNTKLDDLIKPVTSMISQIDPLKMSAIPKINIQGANPDVFGNIDPNTGLPILNQAGLDAVLDKYKGNQIDTQQYRDNWNKFGWNVKSDASSAMRGPAVVGLDKGVVSGGTSGMGGYTAAQSGYIKVGGGAASDADFKKAAQQLGINYDDYVKPVKFVPSQGGYGITERATAQNSREYTDPLTGETYLARLSGGKFQTALDKDGLYNDIADKTKDFYMVANSIDGNKHAAILFKADGSGNLVPVTNAQGAPVANYYTATRNVTGETWYGDLLPVAAIGLSFALPGLSSALAGQIATATGLSATGGALVAANAALGAGMSAITGGDPIKGAVLAGLGTYAAQNPGEVTKALNISDTAINNIASVVKLDPNEVKTIIANGVSTAVAGGVTGSKDIVQDVIANVAGNFASAEAKNVVAKNLSNLDDKQLTAAADIAGNVANVAGNALVTGQDLTQVLNAAAPSILASGISAANQPVPPEIEERTFTERIQGTPATIDDLKDEILKTITGTKIEVAQAMPVTAEQIGQLARSQSSNLAEKFGQWAANDPRFARLVSSPESVQMLKAAGLSELATLASTLGVVGAGGAAATAAGTGVLAAPGSEELRRAMLDNPMLGALGGDASFAAALVDNYVNAQQAQLAKPVVPREGGTLPAVVVTADRIPTPVAEFFQRSGTSYLQYENLANNLYRNLGVQPSPAQIENLASELISNAMQTSSPSVSPSAEPSAQPGAQPSAQPSAQPALQPAPGTQPIVQPSITQGTAQPVVSPNLIQTGTTQGGLQQAGQTTTQQFTQPGGLQQATGDTTTQPPGTTAPQLTEEEKAAEEEAKKQKELQQYQQYMQQMKSQQQKTQELLDPKSVFYLTPEEQAAREYFMPSKIFESVTPFRRGGLASMKRNAKCR